jgi:hypothetical protein
MLVFSPLATKIRRLDRAADTLPQTTQEALFTITGGRILVYQIIGEVTTVIQTQTDNAQLVFNHATAADVDLCADLDITADAVGTLYGITGTFADAMLSGFALPATTLPAPLILSEGSIDFDCSANNTGAVAWTLFWAPLDDGTYVATA